MDVDQKFTAALAPLPCPVTKPPAGGNHETYVTFNEADGAPSSFASNRPRRIIHLVQVHIFTKTQDATARDLQREINRLLRAAGIYVRRWKFDDYEKDTKYHHHAATCEWVEKVEG